MYQTVPATLRFAVVKPSVNKSRSIDRGESGSLDDRGLTSRGSR
jgi:hypothetical protein